MDRAEAQHIQELLHRYQLEEREHGGAADDPDVGAWGAAPSSARARVHLRLCAARGPRQHTAVPCHLP